VEENKILTVTVEQEPVDISVRVLGSGSPHVLAAFLGNLLVTTPGWCECEPGDDAMKPQVDRVCRGG